MRILRLTDPIYDENCYIVIRGEDVTIIDPGFNTDKIQKLLKDEKLLISRIFLTHAHLDHTGDMDKLSISNNNCPIYINYHDYDMIYDPSLNCGMFLNISKQYKKDLNIIKINNDIENISDFTFYNTKGHTKGSSIIKINDVIFSGDTLFKGSIGRCDLPTGNNKEMNESLKFISKSFSKKTIIYPGHYTNTTLKDELTNNPYIKNRGFI
ncbi:MBL fold metallo-hydrolase [bacterium]|nr:MBL fold metallo-hydrolase [bacterium]